MAIRGRFPGYASIVLLLTLVSTATARYSGGTGEANDPYRIATAADLIALGETPADYDKHFILTADIDLDPNLPGRKVFDKAVIAPDMKDSNFGCDGTPFSGVFDGNAHTISHLTVVGKDYLGLFGQLTDEAEVRDIGVVDANMTGLGSNLGGLVGYNYGGTIAQCYGTGTVSGVRGVGGLIGYNERGSVIQCYSTSVVSGSSDVGGLVGQCWGEVTRCYSTGSVSGDRSVGGLVGGNNGSITASYSTGTVSGTRYVGGLVGGSGGNVTSCYSTGAVIGSSDVGGLVGQRWGEVTRCYSTGSVSGTENVGGLVGSSEYNSSSQWFVRNSFWDVQTSGQATSAGGAGRTTAEMQTASTFLSWGSFGPQWTIDEGKDYPHLAWEEVAGQIITGPTYGGGMGTADAPYLIYTAEHLNSIGLAQGHWAKRFKLMADIDLSVFDGKDGRPAFNIIAPAAEQYAGLDGSFYRDDTLDFLGIVGVPFTGVFEGNGHTILNFTYTSSDTGNVYLRIITGLFGYVNDPNAKIKDLGLVDPNVVSIDPNMVSGETGGCVGCLVGRLEQGTITGCYVQGGNVKGEFAVGGIVGSNGACSFGGCWGGTISNSYTDVSVSGNACVGGLVGSNGGTVTHCYGTGAVTGGSYAGGLVGSNSGTVINCYSTGVITGSWSVGGLVGSNGGSVTQCYSTGAVNGTDEVGGLVGGNAGDVTQCYSTSSVSGKDRIGGLVGFNYGRVTQCYGTGEVVSKDGHPGGLMGSNTAWPGIEGIVTDCFWDTQTSGQTTSAGGTGKTTAQMQTAETFLDAGWDFAGETANGTQDIWKIAEGLDYPRLWWETTEE